MTYLSALSINVRPQDIVYDPLCGNEAIFAASNGSIVRVSDLRTYGNTGWPEDSSKRRVISNCGTNRGKKKVRKNISEE